MTDPHDTPSRNLPSDLEELRRLREVAFKAIAGCQSAKDYYAAKRDFPPADKHSAASLHDLGRILQQGERVDALGRYLRPDEREFLGPAPDLSQMTQTLPNERNAEYYNLITEWCGRFVETVRSLEADLINKIEQKQPLLAKPTDAPAAPKNKSVEQTPWWIKAVMSVQEHPEWPDAKIAEEVGKHPSTLSRHKIYQFAKARAQGDKSNLQRGYIKVDPDSGQQDVEAVTRDDNESMEVDHDQPKPGDPVAGSKYFVEFCASCGRQMRVPKEKVGKNPTCKDCEP